jgi:hypothetical protein
MAPPAAIVFGIVGLIKDSSKKYAIAALVIAGLAVLFWLVPVLLSMVNGGSN